MSHKERACSVIIVDDDPENLRVLAAVLRSGGLVPRPVSSGNLAIEAAVADPPDLILLDVRMPDMTGLDVCRYFKQDNRLRDIPIVFISGLQETEDKIEAFRVGGVDFIAKPFQGQEVLARVRTHLHLRQCQREILEHTDHLERLVAEQVKLVTAAHLATISALAKLSEIRDPHRGQHVERVRALTRLLAERMHDLGFHRELFTARYLEDLQQAASLHDIGKVGIPDTVLLKPERLNAEEKAEMRKHCAIGADALAEVQREFPENPLLQMAVEVARSHHENWDGTGYPDGLKGAAIPLAARIVAVADCYDAMTSRRSYHAPLSHDETARIITEASGNQFDPDVVAAFKTVVDQMGQRRQA